MGALLHHLIQSKVGGRLVKVRSIGPPTTLLFLVMLRRVWPHGRRDLQTRSRVPCAGSPQQSPAVAGSHSCATPAAAQVPSPAQHNQPGCSGRPLSRGGGLAPSGALHTASCRRPVQLLHRLRCLPQGAASHRASSLCPNQAPALPAALQSAAASSAMWIQRWRRPWCSGEVQPSLSGNITHNGSFGWCP